MFEAIETTLPLELKPFAAAEPALVFMTAGNATVTLVSKKTGTRFTYQIYKADTQRENEPAVYFVALLNGSDNESNYKYLGRIVGQALYIGRKVPKPGDIGRSAPSALAFDYAWQHLTKRNAIPPLLEVWHEGRCGRCNRKLTVPSSIESGFGPECITKL
jgi:hypothetical protein